MARSLRNVRFMDISSTTNKLQEDPCWLTTSEVASRLFGGVSMRTVQLWAKTGKLPAVQTPGGTWRFRREDIEAVVNKELRV